jgi:hypothetical protein
VGLVVVAVGKEEKDVDDLMVVMDSRNVTAQVGEA